MAHGRGIVFAFGNARETADASRLAELLELLPSAGYNFMRVGLVAHVPDDFVRGCFKAIVECKGQFDSAKAGCQVAAALAHIFEHKFTDLFGNSGELIKRKYAEICGTVNGFYETHVWKRILLW